MGAPFEEAAHPGGRRRYQLAFWLLVLIGIVRIVATYPVFSQIWDEPAHIAAGMEWLEKGSFTFEPKHPPLPRVLSALGPFLGGLRLQSEAGGKKIPLDSLFEEGNALLREHGTYDRNLALARLGILPFFIFACLIVWLWSDRLFGATAALIATTLLTTTPSILADSSIATTDMAIVATLPAALYCALRWFQRPKAGPAALFGLATGLALLSKMSAVLFLPVSLGAMGLVALLGRRQSEERVWPALRRRARGAILAAAVAGLTVWAGYRFSIGSLADADPRLPERISRRIGETGALPRVLQFMAHARVVPAPVLAQGVKDMLYDNKLGRKSYLLGQVMQVGRWYFFPVAIFFKAPIPLLLLTGIGIAMALRRIPVRQSAEEILPLVAAGAVLLVCLPSRITIGLRHVLAVFPLVAPYAGLGAVGLWRARRLHLAGPILAALLITWQLVGTSLVHPDYLPYFNEFAALRSEPVLLDSDLDWGQDVKRLADTLKARGIDSLSIAYHGSTDLALQGIPRFRRLEHYRPVTGWVAISLFKLYLGKGNELASDQFAWLRAYQPVSRVGHSILLYYIPPARVLDQKR